VTRVGSVQQFTKLIFGHEHVATVNGTMARSLFFDNAIPTALRRRHPLRRRRGRAGGAAPRCNASGKQAPRVQTLRLLLVSAD